MIYLETLLQTLNEFDLCEILINGNCLFKGYKNEFKIFIRTYDYSVLKREVINFERNDNNITIYA